MKSILLFTGIYPPDIGGPATFIPQLEEFLRSKGQNFHTVRLADSKSDSRLTSGKATVVKRSLWLPIRVCRVIFSGLRQSRRADVIFANGLHEEAALVSLLSRKPLVCKVVGNPAWESLQMIKASDSLKSSSLEEFDLNRLSLSLRTRYWLWKLALRQATVLIAPSRSFGRHLESLNFRAPIYVIENGTSIPVLSYEGYEYDVVAISRLVPWKNLDILIQAAKNYQFSLAIVGDGPDQSRLREYAQDDKRITFLGRVESSRIGKCLESSKVYALVSTYEGLSYSLIEALAHAKACVVSDNQGNLDALQESDAAMIVPIRDVASTGEAIRKLLNDSDFRQILEAKAKFLAVKSYNKDRQLKKIWETINSVL